jgi:hypothetical protein
MYAVPVIGFYLSMLAQLLRAARLPSLCLLMHDNLTKDENHSYRSLSHPAEPDHFWRFMSTHSTIPLMNCLLKMQLIWPAP